MDEQKRIKRRMKTKPKKATVVISVITTRSLLPSTTNARVDKKEDLELSATNHTSVRGEIDVVSKIPKKSVEDHKKDYLDPEPNAELTVDREIHS